MRLKNYVTASLLMPMGIVYVGSVATCLASTTARSTSETRAPVTRELGRFEARSGAQSGHVLALPRARLAHPADRIARAQTNLVQLAQERRRGPVYYAPLPPDHRHRPQDLEPTPRQSDAEQEPDEREGTAIVIPPGKERAVEQLKNAEYQLRHGRVKLNNGHFEARSGSTYLGIDLGNRVAFGDLNGDGAEDSAVILWSNTGGSGSLVELVAMITRNGVLRQAAAHPLGGNVGVQNLSIRSGRIVVEMLKHGPDDAHCCPTMRVTENYQLQGGRLVLAP